MRPCTVTQPASSKRWFCSEQLILPQLGIFKYSVNKNYLPSSPSNYTVKYCYPDRNHENLDCVFASIITFQIAQERKGEVMQYIPNDQGKLSGKANTEV